MKILALDPGVKVGWCLLSTDARVVRLGVERWLGFPTLAGLLHDCPALTVAALEEPAVGPRQAAIAVHETAKLYGYLRGRLEASGIETWSCSAGEWRKALTGHRGADDATIKAYLQTTGLLPKRSCNHSRDALGLALYCAEVRGWTP